MALLFGLFAVERLPWPWGYIAFAIIGIAGSALAAAAYVQEGPPPA
jgi:hypothetical protein